MLLCITVVFRSFYSSYMNQIDYCKSVDSSYHYHNLYVYYIYIIFFPMCGSACGCVRQYKYHMQYITTFVDFETDCREWRTWRLYKVAGQDFFFRVRGTSLNTYSPLLTFFLCYIVLFQSCCSHSRVFGKTPVHEFPISYGHTEWN